jgi:class 3 adenylate cyclase/tetratricopeptide (TPR) repeat protein
MASVRPAERRQLTVLLCDLVAWTSLSLRLDPEELAELMHAYRERCAKVIARHGGTVAQYAGDAVLAYFGYPRAHEDDAERAIRAALVIAAAEGGKAESANAGAGLSVHIGIATGVVVVGTLPQGGEEVSAVGAPLNLAARLQALAGPGMVVVSGETKRLSRRLFQYRDLGRHALKGFEQPVPAWQVVGERRVRSRFHALRAAALTPLVDRQAEQAQMRALWQSVKSGQGRALLLSSEPGVGKSRLVELLARRVVEPRCLRLWYYCSPDLQSAPLAPLIRQLAVAADLSDEDEDDANLQKLATLVPPEAGNEAELVPLLAHLLGIAYEPRYPALGMSPQRQKQRLFEGLMRLLEAYARRAPVLVVVEDLHWIDPSSDELLGLLIARLKDLPVLAVLTARPEFQSHWDDQPHLAHLALHPLERGDSIAMIELLCASRGLPASTIDQIAERTDGLPLFIEDLTRDVLESPGLAPSAIPTTLNDSLMSRLDRLGSAKAVAQVGAAIGREFSYELLASVAELPQEALREELYRLVGAGLLVSRRSSAVQSYAFKHALVRDAAYSSLLKKGQAALHARIARTLVEAFSESAESQPETVAYHFKAAGDVDNAVEYLVRAAKASARRSGFVEAIAQLEEALRLLEGQAASRARLRRELAVYRTLGGIYAEHRGFSSAECGQAYTRALELCRALGDAPEIFAVLSGLGSYEITRAGFARCRSLAQECLQRAAAQPGRPPFVMGHLLLGGTLFLEGELAAAREHLEKALALYEEDWPSRRAKQVLYVQDQKSTGLCYLALTLTLMGDTEGGLRSAQDGLAHSRSLGGPHTINYSLCYLAAVQHIRGDAHAALRSATESLASAREQGFATWVGISQMIRGAALVGTGEINAGLAEIVRGREGHTSIEASAYQPYGLSLLAEALLAAGQPAEALSALERALAISQATGERFYEAEVLRLRAQAQALDGNRGEAKRSLEQALALARRQGARLFEERGAQALARMP